MKQKQGRGRPPKFVKDTSGRPVVGLSVDTSTGVYYYTFWRNEGQKTRPNFGTIYPDCLLRFKQWLSRRDGRLVEFQEPQGEVQIDDDLNFDKLVGTSDLEFTIGDYGKTEVSRIWDIPEDIFLSKVRELLSDPVNAAHKLGPGWEGLRRLIDLPKEEPSLNLNDILEFYLDERKPSKDESRKCREVWKYFCKSVKPKTTIQSVSLPDVRNYYNRVYKEYQDKEYSVSWIKGRFARIKTIIRYSMKRGIRALDDLNRVSGYCICLTVPSQETEGANPIPKDDFHSLLNIADTKDRAMLLISLNCGYYAKDIHDLKREYILNNGFDYIVFPREKTKNKRVNVLWKITKQAFDEYIKEGNVDSEYLITNGINSSPIAVRTIQNRFSKLRIKAGIPDTIKFNNLRDGAATALFAKVAEDLQNVFLGHSIKGMKKKYINVRPEIMQEPAKIVYQEYFDNNER